MADFEIDDALDIEANLAAFERALQKLDAKMGSVLGGKLSGSLDRGKTLDALLAVITPAEIR